MVVDFGLSDQRRPAGALWRCEVWIDVEERQALPLVLTAACASASFKSTWRNPDARPLVLKKNGVVVVAVSMPRTSNLGVEAAAADELRHMGFRASAGYEIGGPVATAELARAKLQKEGFETAVVFRATNARELYPTPGFYEPRDPYLSYWGWGGGWLASAAAPPVHPEGKLLVETLVYSVRSDQLVWSGISEPAGIPDVGLAARELVRIAISELRNAGLILSIA